MTALLKLSLSYFLRGFLALLPLIVTLYLIVLFLKVVGTVTGASMLLVPHALRDSSFVVHFIQIVTAALFFAAIVALGFWIRSVGGKLLMDRVDSFITSIPAVNVVYRTTRQIIDLFSIKRDANLMKPVMVEWPSDGRWVIGFVTGVAQVRQNGQSMSTVFMPTSPNPTSGYLLLMPQEKIKPLDLPFETAMKMVLTAGMVQS